MHIMIASGIIKAVIRKNNWHWKWCGKRKTNLSLIHHSDRGVQYCSYKYVLMLKKAGILISMTENGEAYENPIAERINGILKTEFKLNRVFASRAEALLEVRKSIENYNNLRPHMSCDYLTPYIAHITEKVLVRRWKNTRQKHKNQKNNS